MAFVRFAAALAAGALALAAQGARAELFRCTGADGRVVYTDDRSHCPAARPWEPDAAIHSVDPAPAAPLPSGARELHGSAAGTASGDEERWRRIKADKEDELRQVASDRANLASYVKFCNRGGHLVTRDEAGIKQPVACEELNTKLAALDAREAEIRDYLQSGLAEECRRAGCLPGWIR